MVVIEAMSTGRFYGSEIAKRGMYPVVVFPLLPQISESYQVFRDVALKFCRNHTDAFTLLRVTTIKKFPITCARLLR